MITKYKEEEAKKKALEEALLAQIAKNNNSVKKKVGRKSKVRSGIRSARLEITTIKITLLDLQNSVFRDFNFSYFILL